jgi:WD40 repeat protein
MPSSDLHAQEPEGPEFKFDPDKALIFKPDPNQSRKPFSTQCLSSDGKMRAEAGFRKVSVYSVPDNKLLHEFATPNRAAAPTFSPDLKTLAFADYVGNLGVESVIYTLELETGKQTKIGSCYGPIIRLAFSGDGKRLVGASVYGLMALAAKLQLQRDIHGEVAVFDVSSQKDLLRMAYVLPENVSPKSAEKLFRHVPTHIALDQDGSTLLLASTSGLIKVIDVETGDNRISMELDGEPAKPEETPETGAEVNQRDELDQLLEEAEKERLAYSPDKKLLAHSDGRQVTVWSVEERRLLHQFVLEGRSPAAVTTFSPEGGSLVTVDVEGNLEYRSTIKLWSLDTGEGQLIARFLGMPNHFSFSPDGQRLIGVSKSGQETIFDSRTGKPLRPTLRGEQDGADQPATAPESKSEGEEKPDPESKGALPVAGGRPLTFDP